MKEDLFHLGLKALIQNEEGKVLLLQAKGKKGTYWDIPGGRVQKGESIEACLQREVYEETGLNNATYIAPFSTFLTSIRIPQETGNVGLVLSTHLFKAPQKPLIKLSDEHVHFEWASAEKAADKFREKFPEEFIQKLEDLPLVEVSAKTLVS